MAEPAGDEDRIAALAAELARLRESERMFRFSAQLGSWLVWAADGKGGITRLDYPWVAMTGLPEEAGLGAGWFEIVHPEDRIRIRRQWRTSVRDGTVFNQTFRARLADGSYRTCRSRAAAVTGEDGEVRCWYGITEDIEDALQAEQARLAAEEKLRQSEDMHRLTLEMSEQIAWTTDADGSGLILSERYRELTGQADSAQAELSIHPDDREKVGVAWGKALEGGTRFEVGCRLQMKDGSYRYMRVRAAPQRGEDGRVQRWYGVTEDVHEQEQAELAQRDVEERYRLAAQATNDAVWDHDFINGVIDWSDNAAAVLGSAQSPLGRTPDKWWQERIHPDEKRSLVRSLEQAIAGGGDKWSGTYRFRRDDGSYADVLDRGFIIRDPSGKAIRAVGAIADLTERHRAEAEIRRMQAELIHVSRLSAMGAMASTLAHELNQPLTAIGNFLSGTRRLAANPDIPREVLGEAIEGAEGAAQRAGEIVRRVRELVSHGKVSIQVEHLPQLIEEACVLAFVDEQALGVRHELALDPAAEWVRADRIQIQQVLINLVRNGVEAMRGEARREVRIATRAMETAVEIEVADTGPGIPPEHLAELFSEFMTTKSGGMGLGLPISRTIVEAHGGKIRAENCPEGGAAFIFTLPRARRAGSEPEL